MEQITEKSILERIVHSTKHNIVRARLPPEKIEQWKQEGYFRHIRNQLQNIHGLKFGCTQDDNGTCEYYFILSSRELKNRVYHMLNSLWIQGKKDALVKCKPDYPEERENARIGSVHGQAKACSLF
jgi:hypothetical protein